MFSGTALLSSVFYLYFGPWEVIIAKKAIKYFLSIQIQFSKTIVWVFHIKFSTKSGLFAEGHSFSTIGFISASKNWFAGNDKWSKFSWSVFLNSISIITTSWILSRWRSVDRFLYAKWFSISKYFRFCSQHCKFYKSRMPQSAYSCDLFWYSNSFTS